MPPGVLEAEAANTIAQVVAGYLVEEDDILHSVSFELEGAPSGERVSVDGPFEVQGIPELLSALLGVHGGLDPRPAGPWVGDARVVGQAGARTIDCGDYVSPWCQQGYAASRPAVHFCGECGVITHLGHANGLCAPCTEDLTPPAT